MRTLSRNILPLLLVGAGLLFADSSRANSWSYSFLDNEGPNMDRIEVFLTGGASVFSDPMWVGISGWSSTLVNPRYTTASGGAYSGDFWVTYNFEGTAPAYDQGNHVAFLAWSGSTLIGEWEYGNLPFGNPQDPASWQLIATPQQNFDRSPSQSTPDGGWTIMMLGIGLLSVRAFGARRFHR